MKNSLNFIARLFLILISILSIHMFILFKLDKVLFENLIIQAYATNFFIAVIIYTFIYNFREILKLQIGFIFIGGSLLKFMLFFVFFYPHYKADSTLNPLEFSAFFTPYITCLIAETLAIIKILKTLEFKNFKS